MEDETSEETYQKALALFEGDQGMKQFVRAILKGFNNLSDEHLLRAFKFIERAL